MRSRALRGNAASPAPLAPGWCPEQDSNLHALGQRLLRPPCLPVPASGRRRDQSRSAAPGKRARLRARLAPPRRGHSRRMEFDARGGPAHTRTLTVRVEHDGARTLDARAACCSTCASAAWCRWRATSRPPAMIHHMRVDAEIDATRRALAARSAPSSRASRSRPSPGTGGECCRDPRRAHRGARRHAARRGLRDAARRRRSAVRSAARTC